jgi:hypothetical protein
MAILGASYRHLFIFLAAVLIIALIFWGNTSDWKPTLRKSSATLSSGLLGMSEHENDSRRENIVLQLQT